MTDSTDADIRGAPMSESITLRRWEAMQRRYRAKIEKAVRLIWLGSSVAAACRAVGLRGDKAEREVKRVCDERNIPRRNRWGIPRWKTHEAGYAAYVKPRNEK
jgi:hypothetical protein